MTRGQVAGVVIAGLILFVAAFEFGYSQTHNRGGSTLQRVGLASGSTVATASTAPALTTTTTVPCALNGGSLPVDRVCSAAGAPSFGTPQAAMAYLASAWNSNDVQQIDYVTNPAGRQQMDAMAAQMVNLRFDRCAPNPTGDYTCFFQHDITPSTSPTTYPNPGGYPAGEAVFTVAPAAGPGWYLTVVVHCG